MKNLLASLLIAGALMVGAATWSSTVARVADDEMFREPLQTEAVMAQDETYREPLQTEAVMAQEDDQYLQIEARSA